MHYYEVMKEDAILGPFDIDQIQEFVRTGLILKRDIAYDINCLDEFRSVEYFMNLHGKSLSVEHKGGLTRQLKDLGRELILPPVIFTKEPWRQDKRLFILALVGLGLSIIMSVAPFMQAFGVFYVVALYFSVIWGLFFYYMFKTDQVKLSTTVILFFGTQAVILLAYYILNIGAFNPFSKYYESHNPMLSLVSCVLGIGIVEELIKVIPVILILHFTRTVIKPQTAVFYGLISGIAFGVFEGVHYQMGANYQLLWTYGIEAGYLSSYLSNIARLTSLPFLHAVWTGIASYYVGFAFLYPRYRISLYLLALFVPAVLHGLYDFICFNLPIGLMTIPVVVISVVLLMVYLRIGYNFHSRLMD
jgi:RsiW-degrading membrane proteinase PrsW (M82 family)